MLDCDSLYFIWTIIVLSLLAVVVIPAYFMRKERQMMEARKIETAKKRKNDKSASWKGLYW